VEVGVVSILFRRAVAPVVEERAGSFTLQQLAMSMAAANGGGAPAVSSIDEACRDAATWACLHIKAKNIASLPVDQIRYEQFGRTKRRVEVAKSAVIRRPSVSVPTLRYWIYQAAWSMFADGNTFGLVTAVDPMARPAQIDLLAPEDVTERRVVDGVAQARVNGIGIVKVFPFGELWHMPGEVLAPGSPFGLSPITYGSRVTGTALAAERFGGQFFTKGGHPTGVLSVPGQPTPEQSKDLLEWLMNKDKREPLVLPAGTTYETIQVDPKDSQFIELMRFTVEQTCRRHGVPPSMVYAAVSGQSVTYANVSQADLAFLKHTLSYPIDLFEDALTALTPAPQMIKLNRDAILEGDPELREKILDLQLRNNTRTINEVRALRDEDPFGPEYDEPGIPAPAQMVLPLDASDDDSNDDADEEPRSIHVHVDARQEPPVVNVDVDARQDAPVVHVDARQDAPVVNVDARQEPPVVNVDARQEPPVVTVNVPEMVQRSKRIEHDAAGRIVRVVEEG
jgi:HK97 family phage portal protein